MSFAWTIKLLISTLLLPPANGVFLLCIAGLFRRRRWAFGLAVLATLLLLLQSVSIVADPLIATLEDQSAAIAPAAARPNAGAIVILGGGLSTDAAEYGGDTTGDQTLIRLRYGATLARRYELPVLITGGLTPNTSATEASIMAGILREFGVTPRWQEDGSIDTAANAALSAPVLKAAGINRILLVTHAYHMPRAKMLFERAGLEVIPAPTAFRDHPNSGQWLLTDFLPRAKALRTSYHALHEWLGIAWLSLTHPAAEGAPQ